MLLRNINLPIKHLSNSIHHRNHYANQTKMRYIFVENKEKLIIQHMSNQIIVSPNSSYIKINDSMYNLSILGR